MDYYNITHEGMEWIKLTLDLEKWGWKKVEIEDVFWKEGNETRRALRERGD